MTSDQSGRGLSLDSKQPSKSGRVPSPDPEDYDLLSDDGMDDPSPEAVAEAEVIRRRVRGDRCAQEMCGNWSGDGRVCPCALLGIEGDDRPLEDCREW